MGGADYHSLSPIIPVFQHAIIPVFQFISTLLCQGNKKEVIMGDASVIVFLSPFSKGR
jgi:hypothetical protein